MEASRQRGARRGKETPAGQRSRREATQGSVGHAEESGFYSKDNGERLKTKQPVTLFFVCLGKPGRRMLTLKQPAWLESKPGKKDAARDKKRRQTSEHLGGGSVQTQGLTGYGELQEWWSHSPEVTFVEGNADFILNLLGAGMPQLELSRLNCLPTRSPGASRDLS